MQRLDDMKKRRVIDNAIEIGMAERRKTGVWKRYAMVAAAVIIIGIPAFGFSFPALAQHIPIIGELFAVGEFATEGFEVTIDDSPEILINDLTVLPEVNINDLTISPTTTRFYYSIALPEFYTYIEYEDFFEWNIEDDIGSAYQIIDIQGRTCTVERVTEGWIEVNEIDPDASYLIITPVRVAATGWEIIDEYTMNRLGTESIELPAIIIDLP